MSNLFCIAIIAMQGEDNTELVDNYSTLNLEVSMNLLIAPDHLN